MNKLDYKFWLGLCSFLFTGGAVVFSAGVTSQKLNTLINTASNLERQLPVLSEKVEHQNIRLTVIETKLKIENKD